MGIIILSVLIFFACLYKLSLRTRLVIAVILSFGGTLIYSLTMEWGLIFFLTGITIQIPIILSIWTCVYFTEIIAKKFKSPLKVYSIFALLCLSSFALWHFIEYLPVIQTDMSY